MTVNAPVGAFATAKCRKKSALKDYAQKHGSYTLDDACLARNFTVMHQTPSTFGNGIQPANPKSTPVGFSQNSRRNYAYQETNPSGRSGHQFRNVNQPKGC